MNQPDYPLSSRSLRRFAMRAGPTYVVFATLLLIAVILANLVYSLWDDRRGVVEQAQRTSQNLAQVVEEQTAGMINVIDLTLVSVADMIELDHPAFRMNNAARVVERLRGNLKSLPFAQAILVTNDKGRVIYDTAGSPATNPDLSDRDYFRAHRDGLVRGLHISPPLSGRTGNARSIFISRRLSLADGRFAGVAAAAVDPHYLERFYRSIKLGPADTVSLLLRDGSMLAHSPSIEGTIGRNFRDSPLFVTHLPEAATGTYEAPGLVDNAMRLFSYRALTGKPLVVVIGLDREKLLSTWLTRAWTYGLISLAFMLIIAWMGLMVIRALRRRDLLGEALHSSQKLAEAELLRLNEQLEARVVEKTAALNVANKELEAFSYSVSHDLRAPLRHLDGFARMAMESSGDLDDKTKSYLAKIVKASATMGALIDDLLALSRAGRAELNMRPVDLQALVFGVRQDCMSHAGARDVEWRMDELPRVLGDSILLRQMLTNLFSNAIKFTRNREHAVIEIRARPGGDKQVEISVRDNGAGFDMRFADKLFGVFQRLHHQGEFEGTGIGLAIVRRIVERHGGKAWAEGELGTGAVFYVTLTCA